MTGPRVEVCFSPALLHAVSNDVYRNVVVIDILRATTSICTAFGYGVASVLPVASKEEALILKQQGWLVAGEEDGVKLPFADFGNSPKEFRTEKIREKNIVYSTTNGTRTILKGMEFGRVILASFVNFEVVCNFLNRDQKDVLIICSGWKSSFSLEDAICAGAMSDLLVNAFGYLPDCDAALASMTLWRQSAHSLMKTISRSSHYLRLLGIEDRKGLKYCIFPEKFRVIPVMQEGRIMDLKE
jgi:2-phosphosulfolactate phosphatase